MKKNLIFIFLLFLVIVGCTREKRIERLNFNREEWLRGDARIRGKMVDYIIEDSILIGKSKREVLEL